MERIRELTFEQRATWGECPACGAKDGEACDRNIGMALGRNIYGEIPPGGAHLGRLQLAPFKIKESPL